MRNPICFGLTLVIGLSLPGCAPTAVNPTNVGSAPSLGTTFGPLPTEAECVQFGKQLEAAVSAEDAATATRLVGIDELVERCMSDLNMLPQSRSAFRTGFK